jgi:hypothetical protein
MQHNAKFSGVFVGSKSFDASKFSVVRCIVESLETHEVAKLESDHCNHYLLKTGNCTKQKTSRLALLLVDKATCPPLKKVVRIVFVPFFAPLKITIFASSSQKHGNGDDHIHFNPFQQIQSFSAGFILSQSTKRLNVDNRNFHYFCS